MISCLVCWNLLSNLFKHDGNLFMFYTNIIYLPFKFQIISDICYRLIIPSLPASNPILPLPYSNPCYRLLPSFPTFYNPSVLFRSSFQYIHIIFFQQLWMSRSNTVEWFTTVWIHRCPTRRYLQQSRRDELTWSSVYRAGILLPSSYRTGDHCGPAERSQDQGMVVRTGAD